MNDFLPKDYKVPAGESKYMKFNQGENLFRILSNPIMGWEWWEDATDNEGKPIRKPVRVKEQDEVPVSVYDDEKNNVKHFWAMKVWNYDQKKIQILEVTQKGIQKAIAALTRSKAWGDPKGYDLSVTKTGEKLKSEYQVNPTPPKDLEKEIQQKAKEVYVSLEALYKGEDPFIQIEGEEKVNLDEIPDLF